jgi:Tol biopolymer transport system component
VCPACLIKLGMSDPNWTPPAAPPETPVVDVGSGTPGDRRSADPSASAATRAPRRMLRLPRLSRRGKITAGVLLIFFLLLLLSQPPTKSQAPSGNIVRFSLSLPDGVELVDGAQFAVSPDGKHLVAAARGPEGRQRLWVRSFVSADWRELPQSDGAAHPFWSPDSRQVGFFANRRLSRVDVVSGLAYVVCDAPAGRGGAWTSDGVIVFAPGSGPLMRVAAAGGTPEQVTRGDERGGWAHVWPGVLPDPERFVYGADGEKNESPTFVASMDTGESQVVVRDGWAAAYARGFLFFVQGSSLIAHPFDSRRLAATGDVRRVLGAHEIGGSSSIGAEFSVSSDVLVFRTGRPSLSQLVWFDREGHVEVSLEPGDYQQFSISRDGERVALARRDERDGSSNIWVLEPRRGINSRVTIGRSRDSSPVWSPDAARIAFASDRGNSVGIYVTAAGGGDLAEQLLSAQKPANPTPTDWSPDGRVLLYAATSPKTGSDLMTLSLEGDRTPVEIAHGTSNESDGRFSPDGRYIAYVSDQSGRDEVYVQPFPPAEGKWQVSAGGGTRPRWRADGRELFFLAPDGVLTSLAVQTGPALRLGAPLALLPLRGEGDYEVGPGGRVLAKTAFREPGDNELQIVLNWANELAGSR